MLQRRDFLRGSVLGSVGLAAGGLEAAQSVRNVRTLGVDLCVVGGSATGVFAAVRAAEAGLKVALVENNALFGGTATAGFVPVWHSLYSSDGKERVAGGLTQLLIDRMVAKKTALRREPGDEGFENAHCIFNVSALELELDRLVCGQPNIRTFFGAQFVAAETDRPGHVTRVFVEDKDGRKSIEAKFFIDATGDADLLARAGFETWSLPP